MSNLPLITRKIKSITTTSKITNALKVVSSNQFSLFLEFQKNSIAYMQGIYRIFFEIFNNPDHDIRSTNKYFLSQTGDKDELFIVLGTDIGMCGDLNEKLRDYVSREFDPKRDGLVLLGRKIFFIMEKEFGENVEFKFKSELEIFSAAERIKELATKILSTFMRGNYRSLSMVYLRDPKQGIIEKTNILPFTEKYFTTKKKVFVRTLLSNEKYPEIILDIFPQYLECIMLGAFIGSKLGEHSIRREIMYNATKNANDLLDEYKLTYNKIRQANITREIAEITVAVKAKKK